jgi:hypothetical protein
MARGMKTLLAVLAFGAFSTSPAMADPLLRDFAVCTGRYSALVEHQWLVDGPASDLSAGARDSLWALVEAVAGPGEARRAMTWRIEAKVAQKALLDRAWFAADRVAEKRSAQLLQACADLIGQS